MLQHTSTNSRTSELRYDWTIISRSLATCNALVRAAQTWFGMQGAVRHSCNPSLLQTRLLEALRRTCVELYLFSRTAAQMRDGPARPQTLIARARYALQHIMHLLELQYIAQSSHCTRQSQMCAPATPCECSSRSDGLCESKRRGRKVRMS